MMTKVRDPASIEQAIFTICDRIGWAEAGQLCGVTERMVRLWSDHDDPTNITVVNAQKLDRAYLVDGGDHAPIHRVISLLLDTAISEARQNLPTLPVAAANLAVSSGQAVAALLAVADAPPTDRQKRRRHARRVMEKAIGDLMTARCTLERSENGGNTHER